MPVVGEARGGIELALHGRVQRERYRVVPMSLAIENPCPLRKRFSLFLRCEIPRMSNLPPCLLIFHLAGLFRGTKRHRENGTFPRCNNFLTLPASKFPNSELVSSSLDNLYTFYTDLAIYIIDYAVTVTSTGN